MIQVLKRLKAAFTAFRHGAERLASRIAPRAMIALIAACLAFLLIRSVVYGDRQFNGGETNSIGGESIGKWSQGAEDRQFAILAGQRWELHACCRPNVSGLTWLKKQLYAVSRDSLKVYFVLGLKDVRAFRESRRSIPLPAGEIGFSGIAVDDWFLVGATPDQKDLNTQRNGQMNCIPMAESGTLGSLQGANGTILFTVAPAYPGQPGGVGYVNEGPVCQYRETEIRTPGYPAGLTSFDCDIVTADHASGKLVYRIHEPLPFGHWRENTLDSAGEPPGDDRAVRGLAVVGNYLYAAAPEGLRVYSLTRHVRVGTLKTPEPVGAMIASPGWLYGMIGDRLYRLRIAETPAEKKRPPRQ